jgi:hypothetical protein
MRAMTIFGYMGYIGKSENRRNVRKIVTTPAWISLGFAVRPCTVINMSATGVRLAVTSPQTIPETFTLRMSRNNAGSGRAVRVKWRKGSQIGVVFV